MRAVTLGLQSQVRDNPAVLQVRRFRGCNSTVATVFQARQLRLPFPTVSEGKRAENNLRATYVVKIRRRPE